MRRIVSYVATLTVGLSLAACDGAEPDTELPPIETTFIEPSAQRTGDPARGYEYLVTGDYVGRGVPLDVYRTFFPGGGSSENVLGRTGDNANLPPSFTAVTAPNGVRVAAPNCLSCHGQTLNGAYIVGLGNSVGDFTTNAADIIPLVDVAIRNEYGEDSPEWEAYKPFRDASLAVGPHIGTEVIGVNPADKLTWVLAAHRDPVTLEWSDTPLYDLPAAPGDVIPSDVPPWWLLKKKHAEFYVGLGRGDFARISMAASLLTLRDTTEARRIDERFADVIAYLKTIEPPPYPEAVDADLAAQGEAVFNRECARCHGSYGDTETYPNLLVSLETIGTDPALSESYETYSALIDVYNNSWFGQGAHAAHLVAEGGYVAPPLDGIWASAPYLHNGSVPTIAALLESDTRPKYWQRSFNTSDYDYENVGWNYTEESAGGSRRIYDTTLPGYGNEGHLFGDVLTSAERTAVIEYLKTL